jgi:hypothetical protein
MGGFSVRLGRRGEVFAICVFFLALSLFCAAGQSKNAALLIEPKAIDLGGLEVNSSAVATYVAKNPGTRPIKLDHIMATCGCTKVTADAKVIPPGKSININAQVANAGRNGKFGARIVVDWSVENGTSGRENLTVEADALRIVELSESNINLGDVPYDGGLKAATIEIRPGNSPQKWKTVRVKSQNPAVQAVIDGGDAGRQQLTVTLDSDKLPLGRFSSPVDLEFFGDGDKAVESLSVSIHAVLRGPFETAPAMLYFGALKSPKTVTGQIAIRSLENEPFELGEIKREPGAVGDFAFQKPVEEGATIKIPFMFTPPSQEGNASGKLLVAVKARRPCTLSIPYICYRVPSEKGKN